MNSSDVYLQIKEAKLVLERLQGFLLTYEGQMEAKEGELRVLDSKIAAKKAENEASLSKASIVLAQASQEASVVRKQAQEILDNARTELAKVRKEKDEAAVAVREARAISAKLESDQKAFNAAVIIFERKKQAIEGALHAG